MKSLISSTLFLFSLVTFSQSEQFAEVFVFSDIETYILNEPVRPYEVVYGKGQGINWMSMLTGGGKNESIAQKVKKFAKAVSKKAKEDGKTVDALVYTGGKEVKAVKFTDEPTKKTKLKAKINELDGIPIYVMCEPLNKFSVVTKKGGGLKWKSVITKGLINNSIEQDLMKFTNKLKEDYNNKEIDAVQYVDKISCVGIKFKE